MAVNAQTSAEQVKIKHKVITFTYNVNTLIHTFGSFKCVSFFFSPSDSCLQRLLFCIPPQALDYAEFRRISSTVY